jgi:hypothetical protein
VRHVKQVIQLPLPRVPCNALLDADLGLPGALSGDKLLQDVHDQKLPLDGFGHDQRGEDVVKGLGVVAANVVQVRHLHLEVLEGLAVLPADAVHNVGSQLHRHRREALLAQGLVAQNKPKVDVEQVPRPVQQDVLHVPVPQPAQVGEDAGNGAGGDKALAQGLHRFFGVVLDQVVLQGHLAFVRDGLQGFAVGDDDQHALVGCQVHDVVLNGLFPVQDADVVQDVHDNHVFQHRLFLDQDGEHRGVLALAALHHQRDQGRHR